MRVPEVQYHLVARVLDAGPTPRTSGGAGPLEGIMLPRVEARQQVEELARFARYRPEGERGISTFTGHKAQIETTAGVQNQEAILSVPGLDGCFVCTGDLAMNMGFAGQPDPPGCPLGGCSYSPRVC